MGPANLRVALFIDGKNFFRGFCETHPAVEINYDKLAEWVVQQVAGTDGQFVGAYYYTGHYESPPGQTETFTRFLANLNLRHGYFVRREPRVRRKQTCRQCGRTTHFRTEKRVDTRLVADMIHYAAIRAYEIGVLFSGDQDLIPAVEAADRLGRRIYVATWQRRGLSRELRGRCFGEVNLSKGIAIFSTGKKPGRTERVIPSIPRESPVETIPPLSEPLIGPDIEGLTPIAMLGADAVAISTQSSTATEVISELQIACGILPEVSRWYFENKWKGSALPSPGSIERTTAISKAIESGAVETYTYIDKKGRPTEGIRPIPQMPLPLQD